MFDQLTGDRPKKYQSEEWDKHRFHSYEKLSLRDSSKLYFN